MLVSALAWMAVSAAQTPAEPDADAEADAEGERLAIPADSAGDPFRPGPAVAHPGPLVRPPPRQVRVRSPADSAERALALRTYRDEHLAVRRSSEFVTNTTYTWGLRGSSRWGGLGWGVLWPQVTAYTVDRIGVVQGHEWLDVPAVLSALGEGGAERDVRRRIQNNRNASAFLQGVAVVGVGGIVTGLVGADRASNVQELRDFHRVTIGGIGLTVSGLMLSAVPGSRADKLQYDVTRTMELDEVRDRVSDHNQALADNLGIEPETAMGLESGK